MIEIIQVFNQIITSPYLLATFGAYIIGQLVKLIILISRNRAIRPSQLFRSGGMPSTHTAATFALATVIGLSCGFDSAIFAVAFTFAAVVAYDAMHVRRVAGEQGATINKLIEYQTEQVKILARLTKTTKKPPVISQPYFSRGHKPTEVAVGVALGVAIGLATFVWLT